MSSERGFILDTVVLLYFLLVGKDQLLRDLIGDPLVVPTSVYDPSDRGLPEDALRHSEFLSEMRQSVRHYEAAVRTGTSPLLLERVQRVDALYNDGHLHAVEMTDEERAIAAGLQSHDAVLKHPIRVALGPGEAACVAIAAERGWTIVSDDEAALTVLGELHGSHDYEYERIRKLLIRAATSKRITKAEANDIHAEMISLGFWDSGQPFP